MLIVKYVKNGLYIPIIHGIIYNRTKNLYLATIISLKLIPANFFMWFGHTENMNPKFVPFKQFIRFTDTGHFASFIYLFKPEFLPIAHNIHFFIMAGYWIGKLYGVKESGSIVDDEIIPQVQKVSSWLNHGLIYMFLVKDIISSTETNFSSHTLFYSYAWAYTWLLCIYIPWRHITKDEVYSILSVTTPTITKFGFFAFMNIIMYLGNSIGNRLSL